MISFRSKITRQVLGYFMLHPEAEMYINELARRLSLDSGNLTRKLQELEQGGILISEQRGKERYYLLNHDFPLLGEYKKIVLSTVGLEHTLKEALQSLNDVSSAFIYGSYAEDKMDAASDIDLLVIGEHSTTLLQKKLAELQKSTDREINVVSMSTNEFEKKKKSDSFLKSVMRKKKIHLV